MFRATKVMWRRHPKLMVAASVVALAAAAVLWLTTGAVAGALTAALIVVMGTAWLTLKTEDERGTLDEYIDEIQGRR